MSIEALALALALTTALSLIVYSSYEFMNDTKV